MRDAKPAIKSKGIQGSLTGIVGAVGSIIYVMQSTGVHSQAVECLNAFGQGELAGKLLALSPAIALAGSILSGYGRWDAGGVKIFGKAK